MRRTEGQRWSTRLALVAIFIGAVGFTAGGASSAGTHRAAGVAGYEAAVKAATGAVKWQGPASTPAPPKKEFAVIVTCTLALEGCKLDTQGTQEGVKALGWKNQTINVTDPTKYATAVDNAINEGATVIFLIGVDESLVSQQIARAHSKHIPVISGTQYNKAGGGNLVDVDVSPNGTLEGKLIADLMIVDHNGKADVQMFSDKEFGLPVAVLAGARAELAKCSTCKVESDVSFTAADIQSTLGNLTVSVMRSKPNVNSMLVGFDPPVGFMVSALQNAGYGSKVQLYSQIGTTDALNFLRKKQVMAGDIAFPIVWAGWGGVDEAVRLLDHKPVVDEKLPTKLLTSTNLPPAGKYFDGDSANYRSHYMKLWGLTK